MAKQEKTSKAKQPRKTTYKGTFLQVTRLKDKTYAVGDKYTTQHKESYDSLINSKIIK